MKQFHFLTLILITFTLSFCTQPGKPEFRKLENLEASSVKNGKLLLTGDAVFFNPNPTKVNLDKIDLAIFVNNEEVGELNQIKNIEIPANSEFNVPVQLNVSTKKLSGGWLGSVISIIGNGTLDLNIKGSATITVLKIPIKIPIDHFEKVEIKL